MDNHGVFDRVSPAFDAVFDREHVARGELLQFAACIHKCGRVWDKVEVCQHIIILCRNFHHDFSCAGAVLDELVQVLDEPVVVLVLFVVVLCSCVDEE